MEKFTTRKSKNTKKSKLIRLLIVWLSLFSVFTYVIERELVFVYFDNICRAKMKLYITINEKYYYSFPLSDMHAPDALTENYIMIFPASRIKSIGAITNGDNSILVYPKQEKPKMIKYKLCGHQDSKILRKIGNYTFYNKYYRLNSKLWGKNFCWLF